MRVERHAAVYLIQDTMEHCHMKRPTMTEMMCTNQWPAFPLGLVLRGVQLWAIRKQRFSRCHLAVLDSDRLGAPKFLHLIDRLASGTIQTCDVEEKLVRCVCSQRKHQILQGTFLLWNDGLVHIAHGFLFCKPAFTGFAIADEVVDLIVKAMHRLTPC